MLDHRVYRAAFLPALVAVFVLAFSLTDPPKPIYWLPALAQRFLEVGLHLLGRAEGHLLYRRHCTGRECLQYLVVEQRQVAKNGRYRPLGLLGRTVSGFAHDTLRCGRDLDGKMTLALGPAARPAKRIHRLVKVAVR